MTPSLQPTKIHPCRHACIHRLLAPLAVLLLSSCGRADVTPAEPSAQPPADYFAEPVNLPYDEEIQEEKQEAGWHWKEFRYTSLIYKGEPMRVHAVYAVPDSATPTNKVPAVVMTHGVFGAIKGPDWRYWAALTQLTKAGYAVLFFDWYPDYAKNWKPASPDEKPRFTKFGSLDFYGADTWFRRGDDFKESLHYQVLMAGKRAVTWLSARPEVDARHIGVTGASYGGIFSSTLAGIDDRITAVSSAVFTTNFGKKEDGYNKLPDAWTDLEVARWKNRFDSHVLLAKRKIPVLYTLGAIDTTFTLTKGMDIFAGFNEPKHLLVGPNRGHDYWDFDQTVLFFDSALKGKMPRARSADLKLRREGSEAIATLPAGATTPAKVRIAFEAQYEKDPDKGPGTIPAYSWTWQTVDAIPAAKGTFEAHWPLPVIHPLNEKEKLYDWKPGEPAPALASGPDLSPTGLVRAFALVTDQFGQVDCTPLTAPVSFQDTPKAGITGLSTPASPKLLAAARLTAGPVPVVIDPDVPAGQPRATLPVALPDPKVGKGGYILWYWRRQAPGANLKTEGDATPNAQVFAPFKLPGAEKAFIGNLSLNGMSWGGLLNYQLHGHGDTLAANRTWHGSMQPGAGVSESLPIEATDDQWHTATLVLAAPALGECNVRIGLHNADDEGVTVRFKHVKNVDSVLQFQFKGNAVLKVETTSQPEMPFHTLVGPSALFLD